MNIFDILYVGKTGKIKPDASLTDNLYGKKFYDAHSGIITTATGNPVSIVTNRAQDAISTILSYSPKQSGSGDPSPQNIRPIEGWTEANLGVNSETPTTTISLGGTYYGFSVDVERGVLRVTTEAVVYDGSEDGWGENGSVGYYITVRGEQKYGSERLLCNCLKGHEPGGSSTVPVNTIRLTSNKRNLLAQVDRTNDFPTVSNWKNFLSQNPMIVIYPLATPIELPLTPQTVALLAGNNTLWTDGDSIEITYKAKRG